MGSNKFKRGQPVICIYKQSTSFTFGKLYYVKYPLNRRGFTVVFEDDHKDENGLYPENFRELTLAEQVLYTTKE